jgi:prophage antirepressor-like protein
MEITKFNNPMFGELTAVNHEGKALVKANDVAIALGYKEYQRAVTDHCKGVCVLHTPSPRGLQPTKYIGEADIYRLIFKSRLPAAEKFQDWVFEEVLPSIRKHGAYMTSETLTEMLQRPENIAKLLGALKDEQTKRLEAENKVNELKQDNAYMNEVLLANGLVLTEDIAKAHRLSAKQVNDILSKEGIIFKRGTDRLWKLYQKYLDWGQTEVKISRNGYTYRQLKWTEEGAKNVSFILQSHGHRPISGNYPDAGYQLRFDF